MTLLADGLYNCIACVVSCSHGVLRGRCQETASDIFQVLMKTFKHRLFIYLSVTKGQRRDLLRHTK